ncbi:MAG: DUF342 domain-containing protein [Verrucomicrobia bacterium]|nr:DUF342 domain-containing protein [Verrucomicrobiota bacterium]
MASRTRQKTAEFTAETVEKATALGLRTLGLDAEDVKVMVVQPAQHKPGASKAEAVVSITYDEESCRRRRDEAELEKYLTLRYAPTGFSLRVDTVPEELHWQLLEVTQHFLLKHHVPSYHGLTREKLVEAQAGSYQVIYEPEVVKLGDVRVSLYMAPDRMTAYFIQYDPGPIERVALMECIARKGIVRGLLDDAIGSILNGTYEAGLPIIIAHGQPAHDQQPGPIEYEFNPSRLCVSFKNDNSVDFRDVMRLSFAKKDDVLARRGDTTQGQPGWNVTGDEIEFHVWPEAPFPKGLGTYVTPDERELRAEIDGHIEIHDGLICVEETFVVEGDLDYHVGNVTFDGSVIVRGDVLPEFEIHAKGNVEVFGTVDDAVIESEGDVIVQYGIFSKGFGRIKAKGDVRAKHTENVAIEARCISVASSAVNCRLTAEEHIELPPHGSVLVGGTAQARDYVCAGVFGSELGMRTDVIVGDPSEYDVQIDELKRQIGQRARRRMDLMQKYELAATNPTVSRQLTPRQRELLGQMLIEAERIDKELPVLRAQLLPLKTKRRRLSVAKCHVGAKLHESTMVRLFSAKRYFTESVDRCSLLFDKDQVRAFPFQDSEIQGDAALAQAALAAASAPAHEPQRA